MKRQGPPKSIIIIISIPVRVIKGVPYICIWSLFSITGLMRTNPVVKFTTRPF